MVKHRHIYDFWAIQVEVHLIGENQWIAKTFFNAANFQLICLRSQTNLLDLASYAYMSPRMTFGHLLRSAAQAEGS